MFRVPVNAEIWGLLIIVILLSIHSIRQVPDKIHVFIWIGGLFALISQLPILVANRPSKIVSLFRDSVE